MSYERQVKHSKEKTHAKTVNPTHNQVTNYLLTNFRGSMAT